MTGDRDISLDKDPEVSGEGLEVAQGRKEQKNGVLERKNKKIINFTEKQFGVGLKRRTGGVDKGCGGKKHENVISSREFLKGSKLNWESEFNVMGSYLTRPRKSTRTDKTKPKKPFNIIEKK